MILMMILILIFIDYSEKAGKIIINTDENKSKWENILNQVKKETKKRYSIHYESRLWSDTERKYDVVKWKYHAVLKILKKCQHYLWRIFWEICWNNNFVAAESFLRL